MWKLALILYICLLSPYFCNKLHYRSNFEQYAFLVFSAIPIMACKVRSLYIEKKTLFYIMKTADYTYYTYVFIFYALKRVGSILSRPELDPFLYIWYNTVRTQNGLSLCARVAKRQ